MKILKVIGLAYLGVLLIPFILLGIVAIATSLMTALY